MRIPEYCSRALLDLICYEKREKIGMEAKGEAFVVEWALARLPADALGMLEALEPAAS